MVFFIRGNRGQSVIEFAMVLPLLLLVVFGITEFSRAWMTVNILTQAAREGARLAVVTEPNEQLVYARVIEVCKAAGVTASSINLVPPSPADPERRVTVTVQANFQVIPGKILGNFRGTIPLSATSVMRHESM